MRRWHCAQVIRDRSGYRCLPAGGAVWSRTLPRLRPVWWAASHRSIGMRAGCSLPSAAQVQCSRGTARVFRSPGRLLSPALRRRPMTILPVYLGLRRIWYTVM